MTRTERSALYRRRRTEIATRRRKPPTLTPIASTKWIIYPTAWTSTWTSNPHYTWDNA